MSEFEDLGPATQAKIDAMIAYLMEHYPDHEEFIISRIGPAINGYTLLQMKRMARNIAIFNGWEYDKDPALGATNAKAN